MRHTYLRPNVQSYLRQFGLRFVICLVVIGVGYALIATALHHRVITPAQKVVLLRSALDQIYIDGSQLATFHEHDSVTASTLSGQANQLQLSVTNLTTALKNAPTSLVTPALHEQIQAVIDQQNNVLTSYKTAFGVVSQPLAYEPGTDLGRLSPKTDSTKLAARAQAASTGLTKAANTTTTAAASTDGNLVAQTTQVAPTLLDTDTKQALQTEATCFNQLATQLQANQTAQATDTRTNCTVAYPGLRTKLVNSLLTSSFSTDYQHGLQQTIPPLLSQLDQIKSR